MFNLFLACIMCCAYTKWMIKRQLLLDRTATKANRMQLLLEWEV